MKTSIVIGTYGRDGVLVETIQSLLALHPQALEILVVDQTARHDAETAARLQSWHSEGTIRLLGQSLPSTAQALNRGLVEARGEFVLFVDDDIVPADGLVGAHEAVYVDQPGVWAAAGQVLQPGQEERDVVYSGPLSGLRAYEVFPFHSRQPQFVGNVMAGNVSVRRERALQVGGFDENFIPPVAYRFETEFAKRLLAAGGRIRFAPAASIRHLRAATGGTRSLGSHLASASSLHGVGDYYYALRCSCGWERFRYIVRRPFREVRTRFHLRHPWWIPVKFVGELRAMAAAWCLYRQGPRLIAPESQHAIVR